jgi:hypothetical protein
LTTVLVLHTAIVSGVFLLAATKQEADTAFDALPPFVLIVAAVAYGMSRVWGFHPALRPSYRSWLAMTPWTPAKPLPLGPVHLVAADFVLVGVATAAAWPFYGAAASLNVVKGFLFAYELVFVVSLIAMGEWASAYVIVFALGLMSLWWSLDAGFFATAAVAYAVGMVGFRAALRGFPENFSWTIGAEWVRYAQHAELFAPMRLGWPLGYMSPRDFYASPGRLHGTAIALLCGWTVYVAMSQLPSEAQRFLYPIISMTIAYGALIRLAVYGIRQHRPPINLFGRLRTGRWIIPGYDIVFVAPLAACIVAGIGPPLVTGRLIPAATAAGLGYAVGLFILLTFGPDRRTWLLTAPSRIVPRMRGGRRGSLWV